MIFNVFAMLLKEEAFRLACYNQHIQGKVVVQYYHECVLPFHEYMYPFEGSNNQASFKQLNINRS